MGIIQELAIWTTEIARSGVYAWNADDFAARADVSSHVVKVYGGEWGQVWWYLGCSC